MITEVPEVTEAPATIVGPAVELPAPEPTTLEEKAEAARDSWLAACKERSRMAIDQDNQRRLWENRLIDAQRTGNPKLYSSAAESLAFIDDQKANGAWYTAYGEKVKEVARLRAEAVELMDRFADQLCKLTTALAAHLKQQALGRLMKLTGGNRTMANNMLDIADPCHSAEQLHSSVVAYRCHEPLEERLSKLQGMRDLILAAALEAECQLPEDDE